MDYPTAVSGLILQAIREEDLTEQEIAEAFGLREDVVHARIGELLEEGLVVRCVSGVDKAEVYRTPAAAAGEEASINPEAAINTLVEGFAGVLDMLADAARLPPAPPDDVIDVAEAPPAERVCEFCTRGEGVHADGCPYAMCRWVIFDADLGIYLGSADGAHYWSQWPGKPEGVTEAVTFATIAEATAFVAAQDWRLREDWTCVLVAVDEGSEWATEAACVEAGLLAWSPVDDCSTGGLVPYHEAPTAPDLEIPASVHGFPGAPSALSPKPAHEVASSPQDHEEVVSPKPAHEPWHDLGPDAVEAAGVVEVAADAIATAAVVVVPLVPPEDAGEPELESEPTTDAEGEPAPEADDAEDDPTDAAEEEEDDEPDPVAAESKKAYTVDLTADRSIPLVADIAEGEYNARDVLSMCRVYEHLLDKVEATNTVDVYNLDREMSDLALEMRRTGLPIDLDERTRVRKRMVELRDAATAKLRPFTEGQNYDRFIQILAEYAAVKARKSKSLKPGPDPVAGDTDETTGLVYSSESAFLERVARRRADLEKKLAKKGVNFNAKLQQAAILRIAGVPLLAVTPKSGQPKISKNELEEQRHHPAARAMLEATLTGKAVQFIDSMTVDADGRLRVHWSVHQITGRWATSPNCFDGATEILTQDGWVRFDQLKKGLPVAQYWKDDGRIDFALPTDIICKPFNGDMVRLQRRNIDLLVTPDHRLLLGDRRSGKWHDVPASEFTPDKIMPVAGQSGFGDEYDGGAPWSWERVAFFCAAQADGTWNGSGWTFNLTRERKIARLRRVLDTLALPYSTRESAQPDPFKPGATRRRVSFYIQKCAVGDETYADLGEDKTFSWDLLGFPRAMIDTFLAEIMEWDGSFTRKNCYSSSNKANADLVQAMFVLTGRRARLRPYSGSKLQKKVNWQVDVSDKPYTMTTNTEVSRVPWDDLVYCVSVPSSYIVVRRGVNVMVVGQCQNWSKRAGGGAENLRRMIKAPEGYKFVGFDYKQIEARIIAVLANVQFLKDIFARGGDVHGELAGEGFPGYPQLEASYREHKGQTCGLPETCPSCGLSTKLFVKGCCPSEGCNIVLDEKCDHCLERDKLRDLTKRLEYGTFYGGKDTTLWESVSKDHPELTLQQVQQFMRAMSTKMPELAAWRARLVNEALAAGEITSPIYGRRQVFPMDRLDPTVVFNWGSQTGAAELWGTGAREFVKRWPQKNPKYGGQTDVRVVHNGHDSAMILVKDDLVEKVKEDVKACWELEWGGVAFQIDAKVGDRWSDV